MDKIKQKQVLWQLLLLSIWAFLAHYPFIYINGAGEGDSYVLVNGIIHGINKGDFLYNQFLVFSHYSFGYYWLIFKLQPLFATTPAAVFPLINNLGFICSLLTTVPLYLFIKDFSDEKTACYSVLIYHLAPTVFEISTYGHPVSAAWLLMATALYLTQRSIIHNHHPTGNYLLGAATILSGIAMTLRADVLFLLIPLLLGLIFYHNCWNKRWALRIGLMVSGGTLIFFLLQFSIYGVGWFFPSPFTFVTDINKFHATGDLLLRPARGLATLALSVGPLSCLLTLAGFFYLYRNQRRLFIFLAAWVIPNLIFWLPFPTPSRHFLYAIPGMVIVVACFIKSIGKQYSLPTVLIFLTLNYFSPLLLYKPIVSSRPQVGLPEGHKQVSFSVPLLPVIENHFYIQKEINDYWKQAQTIAKMKDKSVVLIDNFVLLAINTLISGQPEYKWSGRVTVGKGDTLHYNLISTPRNEYLLVRAPYGTNPRPVLEKFEQNPDLAPYFVAIFPQTLKKYPELRLPDTYKKMAVQ